MRLCTALMLVCSACCLAADKKQPVKTVETSDEHVLIAATPYVDKDEVTKLLGTDLGYQLIVVDVKFAPRGDNKIELWRDDFTLLSHKDGQRSQPLSPTQIAGKGALVVNSSGGQYAPASGMGSPRQGPIWPDVTGTGRPHRVGQQDDVQAGNGSSGAADARLDRGEKAKDNPLLTTLKAKVLPEKETSDPVTGLLYFLVDGKVKAKDLELMYKNGATGSRLVLPFDGK